MTRSLRNRTQSNIITTPNPTQDMLSVELTNSESLFDVKIYDVNGRIVLQEKGKSQYNLDMSGLLPGQYIVSAYQDGHRNSTVVIKK